MGFDRRLPTIRGSPGARSGIGIAVITAGAIVSWAVPDGEAAEACEPVVARIVSVQGRVEVQSAGSAEWTRAALDDRLCVGDTIRAGAFARAALALTNDSVLSLDQLTTMRLGGEAETGRSLLDLLFGDVHFFSHRPRSLEIVTPIANAGTEGTEFLMRARPDRTEVVMFEGRVRLQTPTGELLLASGDAAVAVAGAAPQPEIVARPRDAVAWSLYYPPILAPLAERRAAPATLPPALQQAVERVAANDYEGAITALDAVPEAARDARYYTYRAGVLLNVGRADEAAQAIDRALALDPKAADALAQRAVIEVVQNRREEALADAKRAVELNPDSAPARIALSYALQASFDLEAARQTLREAATRTPDDALVQARLAEIELSFGNLNAAQAAAERAVALAPDLERTQMVLGFAALTRIDIDQAKAAFEHAIQLDSAEPLARLGLGLAKIRAGDLEAGRRELEIAAALDPNDSLLRSYLGKAYFEEKRGPQDGEQYEIAKQLDPNDPTPWFYDAIRLQTENRPVEALHNIEKSIELNDNRAVYRSRLLLDQDLATRETSLARIYDNLGFEQLGLVEGWRSVNRDPSNYSAHRLLADSYAVLPLHAIAQDSELLQAQLLQPLNTEPVQPRLAENRLGLVGETGPANVGLNEYTRLFVANGATFLADGVVGNHDTFADDLIVSGIYNNYSASGGQSHFQTDGFRDNSDLTQNVYNVFSQVQINPNTSMLTQFHSRDADAGDLSLRFWPDNFNEQQRAHAREKVFRVGGRYSFAPNSTLIGSFAFNQANASGTVPDFDVDDHGKLVELSHLLQLPRLNVTSGFGYFDGREHESETSQTEHKNIYLYGQPILLNNLMFTLGASVDNFKNPTTDETQVNPKLGFIWDVTPKTALRAALFRTLKRTLVSSQTIEPTQVAGFNQFFDDTDGTDAWRAGVGIDHKLTANSFIGAEVSRWKLSVPIAPQLPNFHTNETFARTYWYWTPSDWFTVSAEYHYERRDDEEFEGFPAQKMATQSVPVEVRFFHPTGVFALARATVVDQSGRFEDVDTGELEHGSDWFWVADAAVGYRFPGRRGLVALEIENLFDEHFQFQDIDFDRVDQTTLPKRSVLPDRTILGRLVLRF
jgi:tetratricopeptide (TPR) repeat protein